MDNKKIWVDPSNEVIDKHVEEVDATTFIYFSDIDEIPKILKDIEDMSEELNIYYVHIYKSDFIISLGIKGD